MGYVFLTTHIYRLRLNAQTMLREEFMFVYRYHLHQFCVIVLEFVAMYKYLNGNSRRGHSKVKVITTKSIRANDLK